MRLCHSHLGRLLSRGSVPAEEDSSGPFNAVNLSDVCIIVNINHCQNTFTNGDLRASVALQEK